ncbi:undecaprenyl-phosphate glucose phosphotransferase [Aquabacterium sp.]|uniref:undecaprenyl-phosphate glucose phosphotransferase n=1 Tax=Aquabacterium sp. TaxID=1872578 RepID=UPI0037839B56
MLENRHTRNFYSAPQSVTSLIAAFMEPTITVAVYLLALMWSDEPVLRPDLTLCLLVFALTFPGRNRFRDRYLTAAVDITSSWLMLLLILALCGYATRSLSFFETDVLLFWALLTPVLQMLGMMVGRQLLQWQAVQPQNRRPAVVIGAGVLGVKVAHALREGRAQGADFVGYFDDRNDGRVHTDAGPLRLGGLKDAAPYVRSHGIRDVYITLPLGSQPRIIELLEDIQGTTASIYFVPDVFGISIIQGRLQDMNGVPVVGICETPFTGTNRLVKRASDIVLASAILLVTSPLLLLLAIGVKLSSPGPVIFRQRRNGLDGEEIIVYKLRSMRAMDDGAVVHQATKGDARITRFGAFLRRTSLDELPQFVNVLQGRMSIVGPRPHAVAHNELYRQLIKAYMVRHKVKPGITGWAQVNGYRGETDTLDKMQARVEYDLEYLRNWSLGFDLQIIARTVKVAFFDRNAY